MKRLTAAIIGCIAIALISGCAGTSTPQGIVDAGNPDIDSIETPGTTTTSYVHEATGIAFEIAADAIITPEDETSFFISPVDAEATWNVKATIEERRFVQLQIMEEEEEGVEMRVMNLDGQRYEILDQDGDDADFTAALKIMETDEEVPTVLHYSETHIVRLEGFFPAGAVDAIAVSYVEKDEEEPVEMRVMRPQGETPPPPTRPVIIPTGPAVGPGIDAGTLRPIDLNRIAPGHGDASSD